MVPSIPRSSLPSYYPNAPGDQIKYNFKLTNVIEVAQSSSNAVGLIVLGVGNNTGSITYLSNISTLFGATAQCYTRFMISDLKVELRATGVGGNANTFVAASYLPSTTSLESAPVSLAEVGQAIHYAESALGTVGRFNVRPCEYYNDWRIVGNADDNDKQAGLIQFYGSAATTSTAVTAGVLTVSGTVHMCGLRF